MNVNYDDIIELPHQQSERRPHMSIYNRAAQFAPFAALVGYDGMVQDASDTLLLDQRVILDEDSKNILDKKMHTLESDRKKHLEITVLYFDEARNGLGGYSSYSGKIKKIEEYPKRLLFEDGKIIMIEDIVDFRILDE